MWMPQPKKPIGLGFVDKYEVCKRRAISAFNIEYRKTHRKEHSYKFAKDVLARCIKRNDIKNPRATAGLNAELLFYYLSFQSHQLGPEMAAGLKSDFRGIIRNEPAKIDVTTNPDYKDPNNFKGIRSEFQSGWKYYIGVVDPSELKRKVYPLLLPVCDDNNIGHFVLVIEDTTIETLGGETGPLSDRQVLIQYNPMAEDDESAIEKVVAEYNCIITKPNYYHDDLFSQTDEIYSHREARRIFRNFMEGLAFEFRKESNLVLSAIIQSEWEMTSKHNGDWITRAYWVHPHQYVKGRIGKTLEMLDHNIAGVVYDYY